jgi:hypothetical protein
MVQSDPAPSEWSLKKRLAFCFFFIFFILYIFFNPNEIVPHSWSLHKYYYTPCARLVTWLATDVLHLIDPAVKFYNGLIDTVYGYLTVLFIFVTAIFGAITWTAIGMKASNYDKLYKVLVVILRYYLAITWLAYGSFKIMRIQFPSFSPGMLLQTYGNTTPKELAWSFMGYSNGYNYAIGFAEYTAGLLLLFRRTNVLGNVIGLALLVNVISFNYSFDVNVKLLTTVLMAMTLFLLSKDITRFGNFFLFNKIIYPVNDFTPYFNEKWKNITLQTLKLAFIAYVIIFDLSGDYARTKTGEYSKVKQPLYGIYNVTTFVKDKDTLRPLTTDTLRWKKLIISSPPGSASVMLMNDSLRKFLVWVDTGKREIGLIAKSDTSDKYTFVYNKLKNGVLAMHGKWHTSDLEIKFQEYDLNKLPLMDHGFRWIIDHNYHKKK